MIPALFLSQMSLASAIPNILIQKLSGHWNYELKAEIVNPLNGETLKKWETSAQTERKPIKNSDDLIEYKECSLFKVFCNSGQEEWSLNKHNDISFKTDEIKKPILGKFFPKRNWAYLQQESDLGRNTIDIQFKNNNYIVIYTKMNQLNEEGKKTLQIEKLLLTRAD
tara:strand:+ start:4422 stop:4922 length:501 start_codon:yes stop_codon:yes gene_type:complete